jgi:hypothetical protein
MQHFCGIKTLSRNRRQPNFVIKTTPNMKRTLLTGLLSLAAGYLAEAIVLTPAQLKTDLTAASQGSIISLSGINPIYCPEVTMSQTWDGGKLIFSDSPESPTTKAMLYKDATLSARSNSVPNRIFLWHVNNKSSGYMRFSVLIQNNGTSSGTLTVVQHGSAGPSTDYLYTGKLAFLRWLTNAALNGVSVPAGQVVRLDSTFDSTDVAVGYLLHGLWDYTFTQPHTVMVCALNSADNPVTVGPTLSIASRDTHVRGTFGNCNKIYDTATNVVIDTAGGIQQFPVAGNADTYVTGYDNAVAPPTQETDGGNYGVLYRMHLSTSATDGQKLGFLVTSRSGNWGGAVYAMPGLLSGGKFLIPSGSGSFSDESEAAVEGRYSPGAGATIWLQFMPTGASAFPVRLMAVPH